MVASAIISNPNSGLCSPKGVEGGMRHTSTSCPDISKADQHVHLEALFAFCRSARAELSYEVWVLSGYSGESGQTPGHKLARLPLMLGQRHMFELSEIGWRCEGGCMFISPLLSNLFSNP